MYLDALQKEPLKNAGPEERYLLLKLMLECKHKRTVRGRSSVLAENFKVSSRAATRLFQILEKEDCMTSQVLSSGWKGRPYTEWSLGETFSKKFLGPSSRHRYQLNRVEQLLTSPTHKKKRGSGITPDLSLFKQTAKLLLIVLLLSADPYGVVRGLGLSQLGKLTGMKKSRVQSQLDVLLTQGYIHSLFPGITSTHLFGRVESVYFLNLRHDCYASKPSGGTTFIYVVEGYSQVHEGSFVQDLFRCHGKAEGLTFSSWLPENRAGSIISLYSPDLDLIRPFLQDKRVAVFIELWIESWLSDLLSKYWDQLALETGSLEKDLLPKVRRILFPPLSCIKRYEKKDVFKRNFVSPKAPPAITQEQKDEMHEKGKELLSWLLLHVSISLAKDFRTLFIQNVKSGPKGCMFRVMPYQNRSSMDVRPYATGRPCFSYVIEIFGGAFPSRILLLRQDQNGQLHYEPRDNLDELTLEQQYNFGLKAQPRISKVAKMKSRCGQGVQKEERPKEIPNYHL